MKDSRISLSVIIPVYNTARWIGECLDSILAQKAFDLEVICVDDGSTDESPEILRAYAEKDSRVKIITQENRGISATRNRGIEEAQGEYLCFVDSDDTINPEALDSAYHAVEEYENLQIVCFIKNSIFSDRDYFGPRKTDEGWMKKGPEPRIIGLHTGPEVLQILLEENRILCRIWMHLFRKAFLDENGLRFNVNLARHEDSEFMLRIYRDAETLLSVPETLVNYRIREGSSLDALAREKTPEDVKTHFDCILALYWIYSESEILRENVPCGTKYLMKQLGRCQKLYRELIREKPESGRDISFGTDGNKDELFDLLVRYPVKTGRSLLALTEAERKLSSWKYRTFSMLPAPVRKILRKVPGKG